MVEYKYLAHDDDGKISDKLFDSFAQAFDYCQDGLITFISEIKYIDGVEDEEGEEIVWSWDDTWDRDEAIARVGARHKYEEDVHVPELIDDSADDDLVFTKEPAEAVDEIDEVSDSDTAAETAAEDPDDFWINFSDIQAEPVTHEDEVEPEPTIPMAEFDVDFPDTEAAPNEQAATYADYIKEPADYLQAIANELGIGDLVDITPAEGTDVAEVEPVVEVPEDVTVEEPQIPEEGEVPPEEPTETEELTEDDVIATEAPKEGEEVVLKQTAASEIHKGKEEHFPNSIVESVVSRPLTEDDFINNSEIALGYTTADSDIGGFDGEPYSDTQYYATKEDDKYVLWNVYFNADGGELPGDYEETFDTLDELNKVLATINFEESNLTECGRSKRDPEMLECALNEAIPDVDGFDLGQIDDQRAEVVVCDHCGQEILIKDAVLSDEDEILCPECAADSQEVTGGDSHDSFRKKKDFNELTEDTLVERGFFKDFKYNFRDIFAAKEVTAIFDTFRVVKYRVNIRSGNVEQREEDSIFKDANDALRAKSRSLLNKLESNPDTKTAKELSKSLVLHKKKNNEIFHKAEKAAKDFARNGNNEYYNVAEIYGEELVPHLEKVKSYGFNSREWPYMIQKFKGANGKISTVTDNVNQLHEKVTSMERHLEDAGEESTNGNFKITCHSEYGVFDPSRRNPSTYFIEVLPDKKGVVIQIPLNKLILPSINEGVQYETDTMKLTGWYADPDFTDQVLRGDTVTADMDIYAKWESKNGEKPEDEDDGDEELKEQSLYFLSDNGRGFAETNINGEGERKGTVITVTNGKVQLPDEGDHWIGTSESYTFAGWFKNPSFRGEEVNEGDSLNPDKENLYFYAKWESKDTEKPGGGDDEEPEEPKKQLLYFLSDNGRGFTETTIKGEGEHRGTAITVTNGKVQLPDEGDHWTGTSKSYTFEGWFKNPSFRGDEVNEGDALNPDKEKLYFYAKWVEKKSKKPTEDEEDEFTITAIINPERKSEEVPLTEAAEDQYIYKTIHHKVPQIREPEPRKGFKFAGWFYDKGFTSPVTADDTVDEDTIVYAKWTKVDDDGGGDGGDGGDKPEEPGKEYTITYHFNKERFGLTEGAKVEMIDGIPCMKISTRDGHPVFPSKEQGFTGEQAGWVFKGWYAHKTNRISSYLRTEKSTVTKDEDYYIYWITEEADKDPGKYGFIIRTTRPGPNGANVDFIQRIKAKTESQAKAIAKRVSAKYPDYDIYIVAMADSKDKLGQRGNPMWHVKNGKITDITDTEPMQLPEELLNKLYNKQYQ